MVKRGVRVLALEILIQILSVGLGVEIKGTEM